MLSRATFHARPSSSQLLTRVLEVPNLPERVRALPSAALSQLIDQVGLADAAELVALASAEQLSELFDHDLWRSPEAGTDERFDAERFLLWLEVMSEVGERFVAERLAELPQDLLTLALHRHVLVVSLQDLEAELGSNDDDAYDSQKAFESSLSEELDEYQLIWRGGDGWDQVLAALVALDRDHHGLLVDLLERCASLGRQQLDDDGGLSEVLSAAEALEDDLAGERETRRAAAGYVAPSSALAFLRLAAGPASNETPFTEHDPLTRAYFRRLESGGAGLRPSAAPVSQVLPGLVALPEAEPLLVAALRFLAAEAPDVVAARAEELSYLANVLVAGASVDDRRLRPVEAVELTLATVTAGLVLCAGGTDVARVAEALRRHPCDGLWRLAFQRAGADRQGPNRDHPEEPEGLSAVRRLLKGLKL